MKGEFSIGIPPILKPSLKHSGKPFMQAKRSKELTYTNPENHWWQPFWHGRFYVPITA